MNEIQIRRVERAIATFIARRRPPLHLRDQIDLGFRFDGRSVEIFEIRPGWDQPAEKIEGAVAKARYLKSRDEWHVYWHRSDSRWHRYEPVPEVSTIHEFLALVDEDRFGCFFG